MTEEIIDEICLLLAADKRIDAIKVFRAATNWGLYDSKVVISDSVSRFIEFKYRDIETLRLELRHKFLTSPDEQMLSLLAQIRGHNQAIRELTLKLTELVDAQSNPDPTI
jgi:hypothetical protein